LAPGANKAGAEIIRRGAPIKRSGGRPKKFAVTKAMLDRVEILDRILDSVGRESRRYPRMALPTALPTEALTTGPPPSNHLKLLEFM
jgi:hypothetical protein